MSNLLLWATVGCVVLNLLWFAAAYRAASGAVAKSLVRTLAFVAALAMSAWAVVTIGGVAPLSRPEIDATGIAWHAIIVPLSLAAFTLESSVAFIRRRLRPA